MSDSLRNPWNLCPIHNGTLEIYVWFTTEPLKSMSDSQRNPWNLCLIHNRTPEIYVRFTTEPLKSMSDSQRTPEIYVWFKRTPEIYVRFTMEPRKSMSDEVWIRYPFFLFDKCFYKSENVHVFHFINPIKS